MRKKEEIWHGNDGGEWERYRRKEENETKLKKE